MFDDIEATLPPTVMLTADHAEHRARTACRCGFTVLGRTVEAIDTFIERLEATTRFANVQPSSENGDRGGPVPDARSTGRYLTTPRDAATPAPAPPRRGTAPAGRARPAGGAMMDVARVFAEKRRADPADRRRRRSSTWWSTPSSSIRGRRRPARSRRGPSTAAMSAGPRRGRSHATPRRSAPARSAPTQQLARFYDSVLPQGQDGARRITYRRLATLADESNLDYDRRTITTKRERESRSSRWT